MEDITINVSTLLWISGAIGTLYGAYKIIKSPLDNLNNRFTGYDKMLANDKQRLDELQELCKGMKSDLDMTNDMLYQMLDHMATNNNTGEMKRALDAYNEHFRKG